MLPDPSGSSCTHADVFRKQPLTRLRAWIGCFESSACLAADFARLRAHQRPRMSVSFEPRATVPALPAHPNLSTQSHPSSSPSPPSSSSLSSWFIHSTAERASSASPSAPANASTYLGLILDSSVCRSSNITPLLLATSNDFNTCLRSETTKDLILRSQGNREFVGWADDLMPMDEKHRRCACHCLCC